MVSVYVFYSAKQMEVKLKTNYNPFTRTSFKMRDKPNSNGSLLSHQELSCSMQTRGPQPLTKNVISDTKMVELRKKSIDFLGAQKQMRQLNEELGLKHLLAKELEEDESFKVRMEQKAFQSSSPEEQDYPDSYDLDDSCARLHLSSPPPPQPSSPEIDDPFSPGQDCQPRSFSFDEEDEDRLETNAHCPHSFAAITRASTFNYASKVGHGTDMVRKCRDSDNDSEKGGSVRITRHSKRAQVKLENMFNQPNLAEKPSTPEVASIDPPCFNITPSTPPMLDKPPPIFFKPQDSGSETNVVEAPITVPTTRRKRKTAIAPLVIEPSQEEAVPLASGCPFQSSLAVRGTSPKVSSMSCRRTASPSPSSGGEDGNIPPKRKKKVSVAQIEATLVPPTPIDQLPPPHVMSRSASFNAHRSHQDAFTDNALRSIMQISQNALVCANNVGDIVFWSAGASKMFGYTPGEAVGSSLEVSAYYDLKQNIY